MRVTVTELKKMIAESVARQMREQETTSADRIHAAAARTPDSVGTVLAPRRSGVAMPPTPTSSAPARSSTPTTVRELRSMVREVIEEMMGHVVEKEMNEVEELKEAVRKMVRAELKRSGK